jgi:hypothetical protein
VVQLLRALTTIAPMTGPMRVPRPPDGDPDDRFERFVRGHFARIDDAHLRDVKNAADRRDEAQTTNTKSL